MATVDKVLQAASVLVSIVGVAGASSATGGAAPALAGAKSLRELMKRAPAKALPFADEVAAKLRTLAEGQTGDDPRHHLPDMILHVDLHPKDVLDARWDGAELARRLYDSGISGNPEVDPSYRTPQYRDAFLREIGAILTGLLSRDDVIKAVGAQFQNTMLDGVEGLARGQQVGDRKHDETHARLGSIETQLANLGAVGHDGLVFLALKFGIPEARDRSDLKLRDLLSGKADEYASFKAQIDTIDDRVKGLGNLKAAAREAVEQLDFEEVEALLSRVDEVETEILAETRELRARNALLRGRVDEAAEHFQDIADLFRLSAPQETARRRFEYGHLLQLYGVRFGGDGLQWAVTLYRAALEVYTLERYPEDWAKTLNNLAAALRNQGVGNGGAEGVALLSEAASTYRASLEVRTRNRHPMEWATTQNNLAITLRNQGARTGGAEGAVLFGEAIRAFRAALDVRTRDKYPLEWAMTQNNLATALSDQGVRINGVEGAALLREAVSTYRAALEVRTRDQYPIEWAITQSNLAISLTEQGVRTGEAEGAALLNEAVTACLAALEVRTRIQHPVQWAMTQNNLAAALNAQGTQCGGREGAVLLGEAIAAFRDATEIFTRDHHAVQWAMMQENIAETEFAWACLDCGPGREAHLRSGLAHVAAAFEVYDPKHTPYHYNTASALRARILAALDAQGEPSSLTPQAPDPA